MAKSPKSAVTATPPSAPLGVAAARWPAWGLTLLLALLTVALYWPATRHEFVNIDDEQYVLENVHVTTGLSVANVQWAFESGYAANWHPLTWVSHMLDCQLYGLTPGRHHLTSLLIHAVNAALVFWWLFQMTGARWRSWLVAALFAWHPLRVESVAWVAERKDVLSGFFGLLALLFYVRYVKRAPGSAPFYRAGNYWLALVFFALGLLSKPMLVTWPFVLLLLDYWPLQRVELERIKQSGATLRRLLWEKAPFFGLTAGASVVTFLVQRQAGAVASTENIPFGMRLGNALVAYVSYLEKTFWPTDLAIFYPYHGRWPLVTVLLAGGGLLVLSVIFYRQRRGYPYLLMGWCWYLGTLVPVIGLVQVGDQSLADRYTYLPVLGLLIGLVWWVHKCLSRWPQAAIILTLSSLAALGTCAAMTWRQLGYWQDSEALFRQALRVTQNNRVAHCSLGTALFRKGQTELAIQQFQAAIRLNPGYVEAHYNLGTAFYKKEQFAEAIDQFKLTIQISPHYIEAHYKLGFALNRVGEVKAAMSEFDEVLRLQPEHVAARYHLGTAQLNAGNAAGAVTELKEVIRLQPDHAEGHSNLGVAYLNQQRTELAVEEFSVAVRLRPEYAEAHNNLGTAYYQQGKYELARDEFTMALKYKADYSSARDNLARAQAKLAAAH